MIFFNRLYLYLSFRYNPRYYFAIETSYGTTADLKEMIDEMHKNGIRVILDSVRKFIYYSSLKFLLSIYSGIQPF
jgi:glycosidase